VECVLQFLVPNHVHVSVCLSLFNIMNDVMYTQVAPSSPAATATNFATRSSLQHLYISFTTRVFGVLFFKRSPISCALYIASVSQCSISATSLEEEEDRC
jgi:hypothetical protein